VTEAPARSVLLARVGSRLCALQLGHVVEVMRPLPVTPLEGAAAPVRGLALIRGQPTPVVDLGRLLFGAEPAAVARFVSVRLGGGRRAALAVDEVLGVTELPDAPAALPPLLAGAAASAVASVSRLDAELLLVLEAGRTVPDELWKHLAAGQAG